MKTCVLPVMAIVLCLAGSGYGCHRGKAHAQTRKMSATTRADGINVLELFTSEGCSSCPSADALMPKLKAAYGDSLIILSFHVDYWNRLGWKDVFSNPEYTARQNEYAAALGTDNVYTPQAIVNGRAHITGSNRSGIESLIAQGMDTRNRRKPRSIELHAGSGNGKITVRYDADLDAGEVVNIAFTQQHTRTDVRRGENGGKLLEHFAVVRAFQTLPDGAGKVTFRLPAGASALEFHIVAYVQRANDRHITGAREIAVQTEDTNAR